MAFSIRSIIPHPLFMVLTKNPDTGMVELTTGDEGDKPCTVEEFFESVIEFWAWGDPIALYEVTLDENGLRDISTDFLDWLDERGYLRAFDERGNDPAWFDAFRKSHGYFYRRAA